MIRRKITCPTFSLEIKVSNGICSNKKLKSWLPEEWKMVAIERGHIKGRNKSLEYPEKKPR